MAETSQTITWLHLSDLHCCTPQSGWDARLVTRRLIEDLKKMQKVHGLHPDFIFFTGDAAWGEIGSGPGEKIAEQFKTANSFFESVRKAFEPEIPLSDVFIVPGNHDVNRDLVGDSATFWLDEQKSLDAVIMKIKKGNSDPDWKRWMDRLAAYRDFLSNGGYDHLLQDRDRLIYNALREVRGIKVGIAGFNTAWACCRDGEKARLWWAGWWQIGRLLQGLDEAKFRIGLLHHSPNWFSELEDRQSSRDLDEHFECVLHGHEHDVWINESVHGNVRISAAACYGRSDRNNGYNFVRLDLQSGVGRVWLRRFYRNRGKWDKEIVPDYAPDGVWSLDHLKWLKPNPPTRDPSEVLPTYLGKPTDVMSDRTSYDEIGPLLESVLSQVLAPSEPSGSYPRGKAFDVFSARMSLLFRERPQIDMVPLDPNSVTWPEKPLNEKTPLLQELLTAEQVRNHFLPMPRITQRLGEWLRCERDLLFLGLPFCGKTSLLTYLAVEVARKDGITVLPIFLRPRDALSIDAVEPAIVDLKARLNNFKRKASTGQMLLFLDNVHNPVHCEIASQLMDSPRPWRVWGAARSGEFAQLEKNGRTSPWADIDVIRDACSLVGEIEVEWIMEYVLKPWLDVRGKKHLESQVLEEMKDAGQVPTRFLIQVWNLIKEDKADVDAGYRDLIRDLPKGTDAVVRSLMPQDIPGMKVLVITDCLRNPPWEVLEFVLAAVDEYGARLAGNVISQLRRMCSLVPDSEHTFRATMYDPLREAIRREGNLTQALRRQIWDALISYLQTPIDDDLPANPSLSEYWREMVHIAQDSGQAELRVACAERALMYAVDDSRIEAFYELGLAKLGRDKSDIAKAHRNMTEACDLADKLGEETENAAYAMAIWALFHPGQDADAFEQRISRLTEAERICRELGEDSDVAFIAENTARLLLVVPGGDVAKAQLHANAAVEAREKLKIPAKLGCARMVLAQCLHSQTPPDWKGAAEVYQEALACLTGDENKATRSGALYRLARCLHSQTPPGWEEAYAASKQALELDLELGHKADAVANLTQLVWLCPRCEQPPWEEATELCRTVLEILTADEDKQLRGTALVSLARCLHSQTPPGWEEAYAASKQALELCVELTRKSDGVQVLAQLVWLCPRCEQPPWEEATELCRTVLEILTADEDKQLRGTALVGLAQCLHSQTPPDWKGAAEVYQEALACLTGDENKATRSGALYRLARCLHSQTPPGWEEAYAASKQALELDLELGHKADAVANLTQLVWLCPRCEQPPWEEATELCRTVLEILTADEDKQLRGTALVGLAQCLHSQTPPDWKGAAEVYQEALACLTGDENKATRSGALYRLARCLHSQTPPGWEEAYAASKQALELCVELTRKSDGVQVLAQLVWLCPRCEQPPWEEATELCRTVLEILTADEDKQLRGTALVGLAQCLHSQTPPDWKGAAEVYQEALACLTGDENKATRSGALYRLARCLHSQTPPGWEEAYAASKQALELCVELTRKSDGVQVLAQLVWLCPRCEQPPWEEATELCRTVLEILTADEDKQLRGTALQCLSRILQAAPTTNWAETICTAQEAYRVLKGLDKTSELETAMITLASALEDQPTPDLSGAIEIWKEACHEFPCVNNSLGMIMSLDRSGAFEDADAMVAKLDWSQLGNANEESDSPLALRRQAYLALRRNDLTLVTELSSALRGATENARGMLLLSLSSFARGEYAEAHECVQLARATRDDLTWFTPIVTAYFARHSTEGMEEYSKVLSSSLIEMTKGEQAHAADADKPRR